MRRFAPMLVIWTLLLPLTACDAGSADTSPDVQTPAAHVLHVAAPDIVYPGAWIEVTTDRGGLPQHVELRSSDIDFARTYEASEHDGRPGFFFDPGQAALPTGLNNFVIEAVFASGHRTEPFLVMLELGEFLEPSVALVSDASFYGSPVVVHGNGFPLFGEGTLRAELRGSFSPDDGSAPFASESAAAMTLVEAGGRSRASFLLPSALGHARPGRFEGELSVQLIPFSAAADTVRALPVAFDVQPPALFALDPSQVALGAHLRVEHGGLVADEDAWSLLVLNGDFTDSSGGRRPVEDVDVVPEIGDDGSAVFHFSAVALDDVLVSETFGLAQGVFEGEIVARVAGPEHVSESDPLDVRIELTGVRQWVQLAYLPGFYDSLYRYGLQTASLELERRIGQRVASIYEGLGVRVSTGPPEGVDPRHVTRVEVGGPDPNGLGLFGFDNTPGKDIGNLRLADIIGGENAETQGDGYPGYGGVFIESYLYWAGDPLFDEVFGPVVERPAGIAEWLSPAADERTQQVERALSALANVIGETIAHELGHAMGLANPQFPNGAFHNANDSRGCLMDTGENRPFGERAGLAGFEETHLCHGHDDYLKEILTAGP